jgi:hypothetical protein
MRGNSIIKPIRLRKVVVFIIEGVLMLLEI